MRGMTDNQFQEMMRALRWIGLFLLLILGVEAYTAFQWLMRP